MINIEFFLADGTSVTVYDVHPRSQANAVTVPEGAVGFIVWLGTR